MTSGQSVRLKRAFLCAFAASGNISGACRDVGLTRRATVYEWQEHDDAFAAAFRDAEARSVDLLEEEARRRALGYDTVTVDRDGGEHVVTKYSDTLLIFLLNGARPEKYRQRVDMQVSGEPPMKVVAGFDPSQV